MSDQDHRPAVLPDQGEKHVLDSARVALVQIPGRLVR
jgi:hypothetical protein